MPLSRFTRGRKLLLTADDGALSARSVFGSKYAGATSPCGSIERLTKPCVFRLSPTYGRHAWSRLFVVSFAWLHSMSAKCRRLMPCQSQHLSLSDSAASPRLGCCRSIHTQHELGIQQRVRFRASIAVNSRSSARALLRPAGSSCGTERQHCRTAETDVGTGLVFRLAATLTGRADTATSLGKAARCVVAYFWCAVL